MSAVEHTNIPLTTAINPQEDPGNFINIEDLLYRTIRKTHQKTYRNRNRHHIAADTTLQKPASPHKELLNDDPAPSIDVATAENPSKAGGTVEESRKRKGRQKVGCKDDDMNSVKYRASQKRKRTRSAPEKMLTLVKNAERSEISRGGRDHSGLNVDDIESQPSRRPRKTRSANEVRNRKSLSELQQTVKLPVRNSNSINVNDFKFPSTPTPQTPKTSRFSDWTPGSGFDHIPFSVTTNTRKFRRRVRHIDSLSDGGLKLVGRSRSQAVGNEISGNHRRRDNGVAAPTVLYPGSFHERATKSSQLPDEYQKPANAPSADVNNSEEQQPPHDVYFQEQAHHPDAPNEDRQNLQDARVIGEALAEKLNETSSNHKEGSHNATQASYPKVAAKCTAQETDSHTAGCTTDVVTEAIICPPTSFPYFEDLHPPVSALPNVPTHNAPRATRTDAAVDEVVFPYDAYLRRPSSAVPEAEPCGPEHPDKNNSSNHKDTEEATGSNQHTWQSSTSDEEVGGEMLEEDEEEGEEAEDEEEEEDPVLSRQSMTSDGDIDSILDEMEESKNLKHRASQAQTHNLMQIPNAFNSELTWQGFSSNGNAPFSTACAQDPQHHEHHHLHPSPLNHHPNVETSSPAPRSSPPIHTTTLPTIPLTSGAYFTQAVEQLSSPSKPSQKLPSRKSHRMPPSRQLFDDPGEIEEEGILHLGLTPRLKTKLSKLPFRPPLLTGLEGERAKQVDSRHYALGFQ